MKFKHKKILFWTICSILLYYIGRIIPTYNRKIKISSLKYCEKCNKSTISFAFIIYCSIIAMLLSAICIKNRVEKSILFIFIYSQANILNLTFTNLLKSAVGRFRPDFYARCKPLNNICTGTKNLIDEGRRSFPSGHTSVTTCSLLFLFLVHGNAYKKYSWKNILFVTIYILTIVFVAGTRIYDKKHFFSDVFVGFIIGNLFGYSYSLYYKMKIKAL